MTPDDLGWGSPCPTSKITTFRAGGIALTAHRDAAPIFGAFIEDIVSRGYPVAGDIRDDWGYNCRRISGSNSWSWHAWGLAIDLNALKNPMGPSLITDMPAWIDEVAAKYGIFWGGNFNRRKDAMHFELHLTPAQAAKVRDRIGEDMTTDELHEYLSGKRGQAVLQKAVISVLRQATDPDPSGDRPASVWFDTVARQVKEIHDRST
jgi:D-alanyl-D-alanine carboxypeptidase